MIYAQSTTTVISGRPYCTDLSEVGDLLNGDLFLLLYGVLQRPLHAVDQVLKRFWHLHDNNARYWGQVCHLISITLKTSFSAAVRYRMNKLQVWNASGTCTTTTPGTWGSFVTLFPLNRLFYYFTFMPKFFQILDANTPQWKVDKWPTSSFYTFQLCCLTFVAWRSGLPSKFAHCVLSY